MSDEEESDLTKEEAYQIGRTLGWLKRKDKVLYDWITELAEKKKIKPSEIITEALKDAYLESELQLEKMTARQFINVIKMWNELQEGFLKYMLDLIKVFWIEGFRKYTEILSTMSETAEEESKKKKVSPEILQTLPSLITSILTQAFTIIPQLQQNFQQMFTQTLQKQSQQDIKIVDEKK